MQDSWALRCFLAVWAKTKLAADLTAEPTSGVWNRTSRSSVGSSCFAAVPVNTRRRVRIDAKLPFYLFVQGAFRSPGQTHRYPWWPRPGSAIVFQGPQSIVFPDWRNHRTKPIPVLVTYFAIFWDVLQKWTSHLTPMKAKLNTPKIAYHKQ